MILVVNSESCYIPYGRNCQQIFTRIKLCELSSFLGSFNLNKIYCDNTIACGSIQSGFKFCAKKKCLQSYTDLIPCKISGHDII